MQNPVPHQQLSKNAKAMTKQFTRNLLIQVRIHLFVSGVILSLNLFRTLTLYILDLLNNLLRGPSSHLYFYLRDVPASFSVHWYFYFINLHMESFE